MKDNIPPEEKLLRLIRGQKKNHIPVLAEGVLNALVPVKTQGSVIGQKQDFKLKKYIPQLSTNTLILIGLTVSALYLSSALVFPLFISKKIVFLQEKPHNKVFESKEVIKQEEIKAYDFYAQGIKSKQIFGIASTQLTQNSNVTVGASLIKDINLLGVISGANPQAIIEDKKLEKTYYVTNGQMMGEFKVENIGDGKIILNYSGQKFELSI